MFENSKIDKELYTNLMSQIKKLNEDYYSVRRSQEYRIGKLINTTKYYAKKLQLKTLLGTYKKWMSYSKASRFNGTIMEIEHCLSPNYFCNDRIAVYTVIFGKYDHILEPYSFPDNVDYWIVTDQEIDLTKSRWKKLDITPYTDLLKNMNNIEKNRYFKMHPMILFPDYRYSLYIDGNIQVISDITEYVHHIGSSGISAHMHSSRDCAYEEAKAAIFAKKETEENISRHLRHLEESGFPKHYGLLECNVIIREHTPLCEKIMKEWWHEFEMYSHRDQLSLPYVLFKNGITVHDVGTMDNNVYNNYSFRVWTHR